MSDLTSWVKWKRREGRTSPVGLGIVWWRASGTINVFLATWYVEFRLPKYFLNTFGVNWREGRLQYKERQ